jgi:acetyl/propionyl-CoA carboxylase alpha subunit
VTTNADLLVAVLESPAFVAGDTTTAFLDEHPEVLAPRVPEQVLRRQLVVAALVLLDGALERDDVAPSPTRGWRNVGGVPETVRVDYRHGAADASALLARSWTRDGAVLWVCPDTGGESVAAQAIGTDDRFERVEGAALERARGARWFRDGSARLELDGVRREVRGHLGGLPWEVAHGGDVTATAELSVSCDGWTTAFTVVEPWAGSGHEGAGAGPTTPVPGTVTHVAVAVGDVVAVGDALVVLEAMKMEHTIRADEDGVVAEIHVRVGQSVDAHTVVATLAPADGSA